MSEYLRGTDGRWRSQESGELVSPELDMHLNRRRQVANGQGPVQPGTRWEIVEPSDFVSMEEARSELGLRWIGTVRNRWMSRHLTAALLSDPHSKEVGITRASLDSEREWWRSATPRQRLTRRLKDALFSLS